MSNEEIIEKNFYNPRNKLITKEYIESLIKRVTGIQITIKTLYPYQLAFVHKSVYKKNISPPGEKEVIFYQTYESLEFVGDAWVGAIVADYLYHRFPGQDEGFLTKLRTKIVCSKQMAKYAEYLGLQEYVIITPRIEKAIGRNHVKILEDTFEALCAAIKQDLGIPILEIFLKNLIEATANFTNIILFDDDYKTMLLQYFQKHGWPHPTYSTLSHEGPGHQRVFTMGVDYIPDFNRFNLPCTVVVVNGEQMKYLSTAKAKAKKEAEQLASKEALKIFGILPEDY
jgi:ribonuclease-3